MLSCEPERAKAQAKAARTTRRDKHRSRGVWPRGLAAIMDSRVMSHFMISLLRRFLPLVAMLAWILPARAADLPKVLFFTKASAYQHEVTKRVAPDEMSLAEKQLLAASKAAGAF